MTEFRSMASARPRGRGRGGLLLVAGAGVYALLVGALGVTFDATPLILGLVALAAGVLGPSGGLVPPGLALVGWGAAVLLVRAGPIADAREAPAFLVGAGLGVLAAVLLSRGNASAARPVGAAVAVVLGGLAFFLAYDLSELSDWPLWATALVAAGAGELARARLRPTG